MNKEYKPFFAAIVKRGKKPSPGAGDKIKGQQSHEQAKAGKPQFHRHASGAFLAQPVNDHAMIHGLNYFAAASQSDQGSEGGKPDCKGRQQAGGETQRSDDRRNSHLKTYGL